MPRQAQPLPPTILETAISIAHEAGALIRDRFGTASQVEFKGTVNPVTEADTVAEATIISRLRAAFPEHRIHGEESGGSQTLGTGRLSGTPIWLVDPIDGTNNFAHGFPHFGVSIGLLAEGEGQVGVIYDPLRDETYWATRGGGAYLNGVPIQVSAVQELASAFLATGFPYSRRVVAENNTRTLDTFLRRSQGVRRAGSAALDMAYVACGRFDGFWEAGLSSWDVAAGILLVEEAGGRVSDYTGRSDGVYTYGEIVVTNGLIHKEMLAVLRDGRAAKHPDLPLLRPS